MFFVALYSKTKDVANPKKYATIIVASRRIIRPDDSQCRKKSYSSTLYKG